MSSSLPSLMSPFVYSTNHVLQIDLLDLLGKTFKGQLILTRSDSHYSETQPLKICYMGKWLLFKRDQEGMRRRLSYEYALFFGDRRIYRKAPEATT